MRLVAIGIVIAAAPVAADDTCRALEIDLMPSANLQLVAWVEDSVGTYVDTIFITQATGRRGLGNRPGVMDMRSAPLWPHGRRLGVFPIWAHRHGSVFPLVEFQDRDEFDLSHSATHSSIEDYYQRPLRPDELDARTGASPRVFTDKGKLSTTETSLYPPRADLSLELADDPSVADFAGLNPFDAVSHATPPGGALSAIAWAIPAELPRGDYVLRVEVSKELDFNASYTETTYPPPDMPFSEYGLPYRGQPSVIFDLPFAIGEAAARATTMEFAGYSDPDALDGNVRAPDSTITTTTPGSGSARLAVAIDGGDTFRVRARYTPDRDPILPGRPTDVVVTRKDDGSADLAFVEPGDDGTIGTVTGYEIRYRANGTITNDNFASATPYEGTVEPVSAGTLQTVTLAGLRSGTPYKVGIRAFDDCHRSGPITVIELVTEPGDAGACGGCASNDAGGLAVGLGMVLWLRRRRDRQNETIASPWGVSGAKAVRRTIDRDV